LGIISPDSNSPFPLTTKNAKKKKKSKKKVETADLSIQTEDINQMIKAKLADIKL